MSVKRWLGIPLLAAPALAQETLGCDCVASTVTQYITVAGPTVTLCPDAVSASQAVTSSSTRPYMCAGDPCTSWVGDSPASTDSLTFKLTTITQYPLPIIQLTSTRTNTFTVQTSTTITTLATDEDCETDTTTATTAPVTVTVTTESELESTTTVTKLSTTTEHLTTTRTHGGSLLLTTAHPSSSKSSSHHSFTGFGSHGWNLTSSTARLNGTAKEPPRPSHSGHYTHPSAKWHTVTLSWGASHNSSSEKTPMMMPISPAHSHKPSATGWSVSFNTTSHHTPLPVHHTPAALATPYANHTSAALVKRNATVAVHAPILTATDCPVPPEELGNFVFSHQPLHRDEVSVKTIAPMTSKNHLFANGYASFDRADSNTAFMFMPLLVQWYEVAGSVFPGGIGVGGNRVHDYFHFDAFGADIACASRQCQLRAIGYGLNTADGSEVEKASWWFTIGGCEQMKEACDFTRIEFSAGFRDLTSIVFLTSSANKNFYMDHLDLGWTKQDCESATKRHSSGE